MDRDRHRKRVRIARRALGTAAGLLAATAALAGWRWATGNVGVIEPGAIYRSAQLDADALGRLIRDRGIRTVLNLRGPNPNSPWYPAERAATVAAGATQVDVPLSSDYWLTREQAEILVGVLDSAERPILVHCQFGAERTGLVASMAVLLRPGGSIAEAEAQFSPYFLFLPTEDGLVMRGHLRQYERWLDARGAEHAPDAFRRWLADGYVPATPNRTQWPYNPYPLLVVSPPDARTDRILR